MQNFTFYTPTKILFGKDQIQNLAPEILTYCRNILLVYGKASIKKNGLYDKVVRQLQEHDIHYIELGGIDPNPRISSVREGSRLCRKHHLQFILAVGGGSTIDCAKAIAFAALYEGDPWDFWIKKTEITQALPIGSVLTLAATGSEMNWGSVITNEVTEAKIGRSSPHFYPKFSILDPTITCTVPANQTAAGVADIMAHVYESYFSPVTTAYLQDSMAEAVLKTCVKYGPIAIHEPGNYEARANLMWASSMALNGVTSRGKTFEGTLHSVEHALSGITDITHGVGLAILTVHWFEYILDDSTQWRFVAFAKNVWDVKGSDDLETARLGIAKTRDFLRSLGLPLSFSEIGISNGRFSEIADRSMTGETQGLFKQLTRQDLINILNNAL